MSFAPLRQRRSLILAIVVAAATVLASVTTVTVMGQHSTQAARPPAPATKPITAWAGSADHLGGPYTDKTVRDIVHTTVGGSALRLRLSNAFGTVPVTFDSVYLGLRSTGAALVAGSNHRVTFGGQNSVVVPKGAEVLSDPAGMTVGARVDLAVSVHVAGATGEVTGHSTAVSTTYYSDGDTASAEGAASYTYTIGSWFWLDAVEVTPTAAANAATVVALGDSITDGFASTPDADHRWPDYLAGRLSSQASNIGVANEGISGNEVLADGAGVSAQARFDRDVLTQPSARTVILLEGINDIGGGVATSAGQLIAADRQLIARAHAAGLRILGGTLTPFAGAGYYSAAKDAIRSQLNNWIRTGDEFDGVVDFDAATREPTSPNTLRPAYDSGDHLHPDDAGYQAMAAAVNLALLN